MRDFWAKGIMLPCTYRQILLYLLKNVVFFIVDPVQNLRAIAYTFFSTKPSTLLFRCTNAYMYLLQVQGCKFPIYIAKCLSSMMLQCYSLLRILLICAYLKAICCNALPLGRDIIRSEIVWRRRWKVWGNGWAASPAITISDRGCSHTLVSFSYNAKQFVCC